MNREYKNALSKSVESHFLTLENSIMEDIIRRIKKEEEITSTADWQINRLTAMGYATEDVEGFIKTALEKSYLDVDALYEEVIEWEYVRNADLYKQVDATFISYKDNAQLQQLVQAYAKQSIENLENITQSLGFYLDYGNGKRVFSPLAQIYSTHLDNAIYSITSGAFDYDSVLKKTVAQLTKSGLRTVDYMSGHSNRVEVAARRSVMTGISKLSGNISQMNAQKLGTDSYEVAWHAGARPTHRVWQGKVWTMAQLESVCGLGTVTGLHGANCYHEYYPFLVGISERTWSDEWLEESNALEDEPKTFKGKEYTEYEARQRQRQMETAMRAQRQRINLFQQGGIDENDILLAKCKYQGQLGEYNDFCDLMGLKQEKARIYIDGLGRKAPDYVPSYVTSDMLKNATKDSTLYQKYKSTLGNNAPSLEEFRIIKYNDSRWTLFQQYTKSIDNGELTSLTDFSLYEVTSKEIDEKLVGLITNNGIEITGKSYHYIARTIGSVEQKRNGVSVEQALEVLLDLEAKIRPIKNMENGNSQKIISNGVEISINPDTGVLIQVNPKGVSK